MASVRLIFSMNTELARIPAKASILSNPFTVYHPKEFPGLSGILLFLVDCVESTALSKCFSAQGIKIHIRTDARQYMGQAEEEGD
jgi:hypothetical protein